MKAKYIPHRSLDRFAASLTEKWLQPLQTEITKLQTRVKELEADPLEHRGPWRQEDAPYPRRSLVQRAGSMWFARVKTSQKPGEHTDWTLVAKKGMGT